MDLLYRVKSTLTAFDIHENLSRITAYTCDLLPQCVSHEQILHDYMLHERLEHGRSFHISVQQATAAGTCRALAPWAELHTKRDPVI